MNIIRWHSCVRNNDTIGIASRVQLNKGNHDRDSVWISDLN